MKQDRIPCCVPFCKRTASKERFPHADEIICGKHWRAVGRRTKWLYRAVRRKLKRWPNDEHYHDISSRNWQVCRREAIEAAAGLE